MSQPYKTYESGEYLANNPTWDEEDSSWKAMQVLKAINRSCITPTSIVEVGCGAGGVLASLREIFPKISISGFDIAHDASNFWSKHGKKNIEFAVGDFLKERTQHFNLLLLLDVIEHLPNPFEFLTELRSRADYFIFHIPLDLSAASVLRETPLLLVRKKVGHIHYFTKGLALSLIQESGFEVLDWFYTGAAFTAPQRGWKNKLAGVPRWIFFRINRDFGVRLFGGDTLLLIATSKIRN